MIAKTAPEEPPQGWPRAGPSWLGPPFVLPLVVGAIQIAGTYGASLRQPEHRALDLLGFALLAAGPAALALRHRYPVQVLLFVFGTTLAFPLLGYPGGPIFIALIVAFITTIIRGYRLVAVLVALVGYVSFQWLPYLLGHEPAPDLVHALALAAWLLVLLTVGEVARTRRERALESARTRAEEARRRASEERLRIARELHDVLAHNISLINVQAGVALHLMDKKPEQARTALTAIKQASGDALGELRSVLDLLRSGAEQAPRSPSSRLEHLDDLVARSRAAGLEVRTRVTGAERSLPAEVDLAAFRIVQEALTNVTRHAGPAAATVMVSYADDELTVEIEDDGRGAPSGAPSGGRGLAGMRERAGALGGSLEAGPRPEGGFRVRARLPLERVDAEVKR